MSIFTHEKIEVRGLPFLKSLLNLKLVSEADEHGKLILEGYAKEGTVVDVEKAIKGKEIEIWGLDDELNVLEEPIFCGIITDYEVDTYDEVSKIKVKALTGSYLLDLEKKSRSFQDVSMTYKDVVKKVMGSTKGGALFSVGEDRKIGKPLIQYHETDWEFIKRLASHFNSPVIADTKSTKPNIWFGINKNGDERELDDAHYTVGVSENYYKVSGKSYNAPHSGFIYYDVKEQNNCFIGDKTRFRSSNLLVCKKEVELKDSELEFKYRLGVKTLLSKNIEYNAKITGMSLIGTVKKTNSETVNIQLDIDGPKGGYEYPYNWAPTSGNMMYCMPKVGTKVTLLLPNDDERDATATNAPRENGGEKGTCTAMSDPNNRAFVSEHYKKMNLFPELMQFVGTGGDSIGGDKEVPLHTTIEDEEGITFQSHNMLMVIAKEEINLEADSISIESPVDLSIFRTSETQKFDDLSLPVGTGIKRVEDNKNNPPTGGDASYIISDRYDFKGVNNVVKGWDYQTHPPFDDAPKEGEFNWREALGKAAIGFLVGAVAVVAIAAVTVATGGAAATLVIGAFVGGCIGAGCTLYSDYKDGNVSSLEEYVFRIGLGAVTGAFGGVLGKAFSKIGGVSKLGGYLAGGALEGVAEVIITNEMSPFIDGIEPMSLAEAGLTIGLGMGGGIVEGALETLKHVDAVDSFWAKFNCKADPVSTITGAVFYDDVDFEYDGVIPFKWTRSWISSNNKIGVFGHGTSFSYGMYIEEKETELIYIDENGSKITYRKIEVNTEIIDRIYKRKLSYDGEKYTIFNLTTREYTTFSKVNEEPIYKLVRVENESREHSINFEYTSKGYLKKAVDTIGKVYLISTNQRGQITKVESNGETIIEYKYDDELNMLGLKDISGGETFIEYEGHLMVSKTSKEGDTFYWEYDREGHKARCIHTYGDEGPSVGFNPRSGEKTRVLEYYFKYNEGSTESTDSLGNTTILYYDENNVPHKEEFPDGGVKLFNYNEFNELVEETTPDGEVTSYKYNDLGLIEEVTTPTGGSHSFEYTQDSKISKVTNPLGATREWIYNENGQLVEEKALNGAKTFYKYQEKGLVSKIIEGEEEQLVTILEYDDQNNVTKAILPTGATELWEYDKDGNCISNTTPLGSTTKIVYDKCSRISKIFSPDGNVTELDYNYYNKVTRLKDKEKTINLKYDSLANVIERKEDDKKILFTYDTEGRLVEVTNEVGEKYKYVRDHNGDVLEEIGYDDVWKKYRRTKGGKILGTKRSNTSKWTKISYDKSGLLTSILYPDGKEDSYKYGIMGELLEAENETAKLTFTYDEAGNLISEDQNGYAITSEYSSKYRFSQRTKILSSLGLDLDLIHNELGQVENIEAGFGGLEKWQNSFKYNDVGQLTNRSLSEDLIESLSYDQLGRVKNQSVAKKGIKQTSKVYKWDIGSRIKSIVDEVSNVGLEYSYDKYGNLEIEKCTGIKLPPSKSVIQRSFDKGGNVYSLKSKADREYKKGGQLVKTNRATYLYNDAGDLIEKKDKEGKWLYEYFENGLLSKVIRPDKNEVTFQYDPLGRRIGKTYKDKTTKFLWDRNKVLHEWKEYKRDDEPEELKVLSVPKNIVTWLYKDGSFEPIGKLTENDSYSIITDHLGTPTEMYNSKGESVWKVLRDIYGRERHKVGGETAETDCQIRYQGQYEDYETGLYYNRNRYYMPDEGMYSQRDPIGIAGGNPSLYGYVWDSTREVDVFGLAVGNGLCNIDNYVLDFPRVGSGLKVDNIKPIYNDNGKIIKEFPAGAQAHGFNDLVDNYVGYAQKTNLGNAMLYQLEGSLNGTSGRFEWIIQDCKVTHRMFVSGGTMNGVPIQK